MDSMVYAALAAGVDLIHALLMAVWVLGLPLLFVRRRRRLQRAYAIYAVLFVVGTRLSMALLGECFLTSAVRPLWARAGSDTGAEWFTVRLANWIFEMTPSHHAISVVSEVLVGLTAIGILLSIRGPEPRPQP